MKKIGLVLILSLVVIISITSCNFLNNSQSQSPTPITQPTATTNTIR